MYDQLFTATRSTPQPESGLPTAGGSRFMVRGICLQLRYPHLVKVRLQQDRHLRDEDLPWCFPLLPTGFQPQAQELLNVFIPDPQNPLERYWIGPVITDWSHLPGQPYPGATFTTSVAAWSALAGEAPPLPGDTRFPDPRTPARTHLLTRTGTDAVFDPSGAWLRAGLNPPQPGSQQLPAPAIMGVHQPPQTGPSTALIQADEIVLRSGAGLRPQGNALPEPGPEVNQEQTHPLAFADETVRVLDLLRRVLIEHIHPSAGKPAVASQLLKELVALNLENIGSKTLRGS